MESRLSKKSSSSRGPLDIKHCLAENMTFASSLKSNYIKLFVSIIKSLNIGSETEIELTPNGLKYIVEESKSFQIKAFIKESFFSTFLFKPKTGINKISFGVNLNSFTDLLTAFIDNDLGNMQITYFDCENLIVFTCTQIDEPPVKKIKQRSIDDDDSESDDEEASEIRTEYYLKTMHSNDPIDFSTAERITSDIILDASFFLMILNDFDRTVEDIALKVTQRKLQLKSRGCHQSTAVATLPSSSTAFDKFECKEPARFVYKFAYFRVLMKALSLASKVSIRSLADGLLRIQLKVKVDEEDSSAFIEYNMMPNIEDAFDEED